MSLTLYWASGSPYSWRVLLALLIKKIPYESRLLEFSKGDLRTPQYLALNPRGRVPALTDGTFAVYESIAILSYLEKKQPEPALFGTSPEQHGTIIRMIVEYEKYLDDPVESFILPLYRGQATEAAAQIRASAQVIARELRSFESAASASPWLAGDAISAADLVLFPGIKSLERASEKPAARDFDLPFHPISAQYPALAAWTKRIEALPGYEQTYPPHWR
jgi:glutathione S-transferase